MSFRGFAMQARDRADDGTPRFGFTVTKEMGTATERNRMRRRLKEAVRVSAPLAARPGFDYVVLARREALALPFDALTRELDRAFSRIHAPAPPDAARRRETQAPC